ncbi:hypothetical protein B0H66DRAFT_298213 [Apodospora peruviana]|uniref:Uncharacterized protein n=1 Tax=Apodospora peruviana TaxID=516989 RepID=A0AAE0M264_9PEZI|nr:hypothetical protein B0H66DRAFT_298213 [Apodospora peruviana]
MVSLFSPFYFWLCSPPPLGNSGVLATKRVSLEHWRAPLGESGVLDFFLPLVRLELGHEVKSQILRVIGNACADDDDNRAKLVKNGGLKHIIKCFGDDDLLNFVLPVTYNICVDYDPAQAQASKEGLSKILIDIISSPRLAKCEKWLEIIVKSLELLVSQDVEPTVASPDSAGRLLLFAAESKNCDNLIDLELFILLCKVALVYLTYEQFKLSLIQSVKGVWYLEQAFTDTYGRDDLDDASTEQVEELDLVRKTFVETFADITALPAFTDKYELDSPEVRFMLDKWLNSSPDCTQLQTAACLSLGNIASSDTRSMRVSQLVANRLIDILRHAVAPEPDSEDMETSAAARSPAGIELLHAALGLTKNLAIPQANKPLLGAGLLDLVLPTLWTTTSFGSYPRIPFLAVSITRLLVLNCSANVKRMIGPSPRHNHPNLVVHHSGDMEWTSGATATNVQTLIELTARPDIPANIQAELERIVCHICLVLATHTAKQQGVPAEDEREQHNHKYRPLLSPKEESNFYKMNPAVEPMLVKMLTKKGHPVIQGEVYYLLAVLAYSSSLKSAKRAMRIIKSNDVLRALLDLVFYDGSGDYSLVECGLVKPDRDRTLSADADAGLGAAWQKEEADRKLAAAYIAHFYDSSDPEIQEDRGANPNLPIELNLKLGTPPTNRKYKPIPPPHPSVGAPVAKFVAEHNGTVVVEQIYRRFTFRDVLQNGKDGENDMEPDQECDWSDARRSVLHNAMVSLAPCVPDKVT